jgi:hypothetical protein
LIPDLFGAQFFEEAGEEVAGVVDENVDSAELCHRGRDGGLRIWWVGAARAALAMSKPKPRPAPVTSQTFCSAIAFSSGAP